MSQLRETLHEHLDRVAAMSQAEKDEYLKINYRHHSQVWPDYLDYLEEWQDDFKNKLNRVRKSYIYEVLAKRRATMKCGDHTHTFSTHRSSDVIYFPTADTYINVDACWYKEIAHQEERLSALHGYQATRDCQIRNYFIKRLTMCSLTTEDISPVEPTFDSYTLKWNSGPNRNAAQAVLHASKLPPLVLREPLEEMESQDVNTEMLDEGVPSADFPKAFGPSTDKHIILKASSVEKDHAFHVLLRSSGNDGFIFNTINDLRADTLEHDLLSSTSLASAIAECDFCQSMVQPSGLSFPGLYYAPPGNGKTTAIKKGLFSGIDTDWIGYGFKYHEIVEPFIKAGIAVVTSQYTLALGTPAKLVGHFNKHKLRFNPEGAPYTPEQEIRQALTVLGDDAFIIFDSHLHMGDNALIMMISQWILCQTRRSFPTCYDSEHSKVSEPFIRYRLQDLTAYIDRVKLWFSSKSKQRRRYKQSVKMRRN